MKKIASILVLMIGSSLLMLAQERVVKIDFESGSFTNNPNIPFDQPFLIQGETGRETEFVKVNISYEGKNYVLHSFHWNRIKNNQSETFNIVVPAILRSNTTYDFEIITYTLLTTSQKEILLKNVEDRIRFLLMNNIYFDGKNVIVNKPKEAYNELAQLINESFKHYESKNIKPLDAPSQLVMDELKKQSNFKFGRIFNRANHLERDDIANELVTEKVEHLVRLISSELAPYINSQLVQHYRQTNIRAVETDREPFTLPVNVGMYAWDKAVSINNTTVNSIDFTPGAGVTIPFNNKSRLTSGSRIFDSFGLSAGVLFQPVVDNSGVEFVTPGVNLPVYSGLGFRVFKVVRVNAGVLVLGERGAQSFDNLSVLPTVGLALELNLWMGIKK